MPTKSLVDRISDQLVATLNDSKVAIVGAFHWPANLLVTREWPRVLGLAPTVSKEVVSTVRKEYGKMTFDELLDDLSKDDDASPLVRELRMVKAKSEAMTRLN